MIAIEACAALLLVVGSALVLRVAAMSDLAPQPEPALEAMPERRAA